MAAPPTARSAGPGGGGDHDGEGKKEKLGHRRIDELGEVSYKKVPTNALMQAIQLGIANSISSLASCPKRDILVQDFQVVQTVNFPSSGSTSTPAHQFGDFRFRSYAPLAFRYFRELFHIKPADFLKSIAAEPLKELSNAGASGSIFYVSSDDQYIIKTVQHKEADFLQTLLPGYYMNLNQNPRTLLPKFFGLFCYQSLGKNIRLLVMNNLLPQSVEMHEKFDLKGSTYKRLASSKERAKSHPTLKDLDFIENHPDGFQVDPQAYDLLLRTLHRDCLVLQSFKIMDYSLLVGIHNVDSDRAAGGGANGALTRGYSEGEKSEEELVEDGTAPTSSRRKEDLDEDIPGRILARNANGDRLILFLGIIDILQMYRLFKKLEHTWKSVLHDGETISVTNPNFYATRFLNFMQERLFKRATALKSSPSRRKTRRSVGDRGTKEEEVDKEPAGPQSARRPVAAERDDTPVSARDVQPIIRSAVRRSYQRADTEGAPGRSIKKETKRLFAPSSNADEAEELVVSGV